MKGIRERNLLLSGCALVLEALRNEMKYCFREQWQRSFRNSTVICSFCGRGFSDQKRQTLKILGCILSVVWHDRPLSFTMKAGRKKKGSVGEVTPGVHIRIVDGEVQVSGQSVMLGYYKDQAATDEVLTAG